MKSRKVDEKLKTNWKNRIRNWADQNRYHIMGWAICIVLVALSTYGIYTMLQGIQNEKPIAEIEMGNSILEMEQVDKDVVDEIEIEEVEPTPEIESIIPSIQSTVAYYPLTDDERYLIECIVTGEAGNQPYEGKIAVANCILNAWLKEQTTLNEVLDKYGYKIWTSLEKFEMECMEAYGNTDLADEVRAAVSQVFDDGDILNEEILWFYAPKWMKSGTSEWHESQRFVIEIGNHRFFGTWN